jgi:hypothetical protein
MMSPEKIAEALKQMSGGKPVAEMELLRYLYSIIEKAQAAMPPEDRAVAKLIADRLGEAFLNGKEEYFSSMFFGSALFFTAVVESAVETALQYMVGQAPMTTQKEERV